SARGRGKFGTFGHGGMSGLNPDCSLHGPVNGYGPMNQVTIPNILSMILAKKCGVSHPELDPAIAVAYNFYTFYCDKGLIPYGEHVPSLTANEDNGRQALAAVMFSFDPAKNHETNYFCRMAMASGDQRENGHTGPYFGYFWEPLGVNIGGPDAMAAYFSDLAWWYDLNRRWDGSFAYVEGDGSPAGLTYRGWTMTPAAMLHYAVPLKKLYITGKNLSPALALTSNERAESMAASKFTLEHAASPKTTAQLTAALGSFSPAIRNNWAAGYLAADPNHPSVAQLANWALGSDARLAEGACATLGFLKDPASTPTLTSLLSSPNRSLRIMASRTLDNMDESARPAAVDMLNAIISNQMPLDPMSSDPLQQATSELANGLFYDNTGLLSKSFTGYDRALVVNAIRVLMQSPDSWARRCLYDVLDLLTFEEIKNLGPVLIDAVQYKAPANGMASKSIRISGSKVLAKYRVVEGIPIIANLMELFEWGKDWFQEEELKALLVYGGSLNFMPGPNLDIYNRVQTIEDFWLDKAGPTDEHVITARQIREKMANDPAALPLVYLLNQPPVANNSAFWVYENTGIGSSVGSVLANDVVPSDTLTYSISAGNTGGAFAINSSTGAITVAGALNYATLPTYNLTVTVTDSGLLTDTAAVTISVYPVNHGSNSPPVVNDQSFALNENTSIGSSVGTVTSSDPNAGDIRTYAITAGNTGGAFSINSLTGQISVAAGLDFETKPSYVLTLAVTDGLLIDTAAITITINNVNDAPVAAAQSVSTAEDTAKTITLQATDIENSPLTYAIVTFPSHAALSGTPPNLTYTPDANFNGPDSFTFKANDGALDSVPATVTITVTAVNDAPVAYDQSVSLPQNVATKITLVGDDVEGSTLTYTNVTQPTHGTLGTGAKPTYTPAAGFSGIDSFTFKCNDGSLDSNVATVTITVTGGTNQPPVAAAQSVSTAEDTPKPITLLATDANGDALNYSIVTQPASGSLSGIAPNVTYTPAANYNGIASFTFRANDGSVDSNVATVTITVTAVNDAPVATSQSVSTSKNTAKTITLQATDVESSPLTYTTITQPAYGSLGGIAPNLTYTPVTGYTGPDSFTFKANDGTLDSAPATVIITVTVVNDAPVAIAQSVSTPEDTAKAITLLATDADSNPLTYATVAQPAHGTLSGIVPNVTYTPSPNYNGADSFTFKANDGLVDSLPATVTIMVTAINDAPVATAQNVSTAKNTAKAITLTATDPDNNPLTYATVTSPTHGTLSGTAPNLSYTPTTDYTGADSFTFKANDGSLDSAPAIVTLTVTSGSTWVSTDIGSGQLPGSLSINGGTFTQAGSGTLLMASPASDTLRFTYQVLSGDGEISARIPVLQDTGTSSRVGVMIRETLAPGSKYFFVGMTGSNGSRSSLRSITDESQSGKTYTAVTVPNSWVRLVRSGGTLSVYTSTDGSSWGASPLRTSNMSLATIVYIGLAVNSGSDTTLNTSQFDHVYLSGSGTPVNYAPVATAQSAITAEDTAIPIILTATDANTDPLTYAIGTSPAHGTLSGTAPILTYTPDANYYGSDSFTFMANDGTIDSAPATVTLTITAVNDAPVATAQSISTAEDTAHAITLAGTDVEGNALTYAIVTSPAHGILSGTLPNLTYTPMANYNGPDSFTFKANDGLIESAIATTVTISVTAVNDPPVATSQSVITPEDTALPISLAATDVDNDALTYATITQPAHGALSGTAPNLIYSPESNYNGSDSFTFKANDGTIDSAPATVTITVTRVNDPPVANNTAFNINENSDSGTLVGTVTASDPDAGDTRTYAITAGNTGGAFAINSLTGQISVAGVLDHESIPIYDLSVTVTDSGQLTAIADIIITVDDINEPPVAMPQSISMGPNTTKGIILHATDPENDPLTYSVVTQPAHGTLSATAPNKTYTPSTSYTGPDSFTFIANDGIFDSLPATVTITITAGSNAAPVATAQSVSTEQNTAKPITLLATDADANPLTYTVVTQPAHGTLSGSTPNLSYTPATGYTGGDSFTFKANDGTADSAAAVVTISITAPTGLPAPWQTTDIGSGMLAGSVTYNAGTFTQAGSGTLLMNVSPIADTFHFTYQILSGDGMIIAKIPVFQYTGGSSRVGVMLRESLAPGSRFVLSGLTESNAYRWTRRTTTDAKQTSTNYGYGIAPNIWVRLVRSANSMYGYTSPDGSTWTATGTSTMVLPSNVYIGLAVNSGSDTTLNTSQFSNVTVSGTIITPLGTYSSWAASNIVTGGETGDADHDGLTNLDEYTLGTDPHISNLSLLALAPAAANSFTLTFQARAASGTGYEGLTRKYDVQVSSDLAPGSWQNVSGYTSIIGNGQSVVVTLPITQSRKFYRLNVHLE
ncbi:MAG: Ig-like domain-containing protein, partial [Verrucomicrobiota bacterium]